MKKFILLSQIVILSAVLISSVHAAPGTSPINNTDDIIKVLDKIAGFIAAAFWIASTIAIFYAGFLYLTAGDSEDKIKKAHKTLLYAVIAIAVALFAYGMPKLIESILTPGGSPAGPCDPSTTYC